MKFRMIKPFVVEMITFIFVIAGILGSLLIGDFVEISFRIHLITISLFIIIFLIILYLFSRVINIGVRTLLDYFLKSIKEDEYILLKIEPYKASVFTEKFGGNKETSLGMYYLIHAKKNDKVYTFLSSQYIGMEEEKKYKIKYGQYSHVFLDAYEVC